MNMAPSVVGNRSRSIRHAGSKAMTPKRLQPSKRENSSSWQLTVTVVMSSWPTQAMCSRWHRTTFRKSASISAPNFKQGRICGRGGRGIRYNLRTALAVGRLNPLSALSLYDFLRMKGVMCCECVVNVLYLWCRFVTR